VTAGERDGGLTSAERDELRELRTRVKRLAQERDILKRATALLARKAESRGRWFSKPCDLDGGPGGDAD
jgi:transposase-like protein